MREMVVGVIDTVIASLKDAEGWDHSTVDSVEFIQSYHVPAGAVIRNQTLIEAGRLTRFQPGVSPNPGQTDYGGLPKDHGPTYTR